MTTKQFLPLPYGQDDFDNLKADGCYFVDKTSSRSEEHTSELQYKTQTLW